MTILNIQISLFLVGINDCEHRLSHIFNLPYNFFNIGTGADNPLFSSVFHQQYYSVNIVICYKFSPIKAVSEEKMFAVVYDDDNDDDNGRRSMGILLAHQLR